MAKLEPEVGMRFRIKKGARRYAEEEIEIIAVEIPSWFERWFGGKSPSCDVRRENGRVPQVGQMISWTDLEPLSS